MAGLARCLVNRGRRPTFSGFSGFSGSRDGNVYLLCALGRQSHGLAVPRKHLVTLFGTRKRCDMQGFRAQRLQPQPIHQQNIVIRLMSTHSRSSFVKDLMSSPPPALCLGFAGAIPFCSLAALSITAPSYMDIIAQAQCAYSATILSFLGAIHWGYALAKDSGLQPNWGTLGYSVTPSLVAAVALLLKPTYGLMTLSLGLLYALTTDLATVGFPLWYYALRKSLSTLAVSSVLVTLGSILLH